VGLELHIGVQAAVERIERGEVVAIPTDTVYGLAARFLESEKLFRLKEREESNSFLILAADVHAIEPFLATAPESFYALADAFWPGGCTLVLPVDLRLVPDRVRAGRPTAGFRVPDKAEALELLRATGPLAVTSANISDQPPAISAEKVEAIFGADFPVIDGGVCVQGVPSTILVYEKGSWSCVRQGAVSMEEVERVLQ
jgi:L-threonylcarbamoyladenylate synthase